MGERTLRVGLIGYGFAGQTFHAPLLGACDGLDLVAVASSQADRVHADLPDVAVASDPLALCQREDLDLIVIASPNDTHAPLAKAALQTGRNVVIDKPFAVDLAQARELTTLAERQQRLLSVFHNRRWDSDFLSVRAAIEQGVIGRVTHFESHIDRYRPEVRQRWREQEVPGGGLWFDLGPHLIDQALQLFGLPRRVLASLAVQRTGAVAVDWAHAVLEYDALRVILHADMLAATVPPRFLVHGERGSLLKRGADQQENQLRAGQKPGSVGWGVDPDPLRFDDGAGKQEDMPATPGDQRGYYQGIAAALRGHAANPVPPVQALAVMAVIEAAVASAHGGRAEGIALSEAEVAAWERLATA